MHLPNWTNFPVVSQGRIADLSRGFQAYEAKNGSTTITLACICAACVVAAVVVHWIVKHRSTRRIDDPNRLFVQLCRANRLSRHQEKLLRKVAASKKLSDPTSLFTDPTLWLIQPGSNRVLNHPAAVRQLMRIQQLLFRSPNT